MSPFDPRRHHRRSIRLRGFDYSTAGSYFITLCCQDRLHRFGHIENHKMILNDLGEIAAEEWLKLPDRFPRASLGPFQIMPDHIHFILSLIDEVVGAPLAGAPTAPLAGAPTTSSGRPQGSPPHNPIQISGIIGAYKSLVFNRCLEIFKSKNKMMGKLWQRNYYERIIRDRAAYRSIAKYIYQNPAKWRDKVMSTHDHHPGEHLY